MDRNKMKRKIAMMLCVCVLFASSAPLALAEATLSEPQVATTGLVEEPTMGDTTDTSDNNKNEPDGNKNENNSPTFKKEKEGKTRGNEKGC